MPRVGYNPANVTIKTDARVTIDKAFIAHLELTAAQAAAASAAGVMALTNLGAAAQEITVGLAHPAVPRSLSIVGNVSGITGNVKIYGTNYAGEAIDETIALNGTTTVNGNKAFRSVTQVDLPVQVHTPAAQTETMEVTAAVSSAGDVTLALTAAALGEESPKSVVVTLTTDENTVTKVAAAMVEALNHDEDVSAHFVASNEAGVITLTALTPLANDVSLALAFTDTDTTGVTMGSSTNGTGGVPYDKVSVGWGNKLGLPYMLEHNTVLAAYLNNTIESTPPTVAVDDDEVEKNTVLLASALNGTVVDIYLIV